MFRKTACYSWIFFDFLSPKTQHGKITKIEKKSFYSKNRKSWKI